MNGMSLCVFLFLFYKVFVCNSGQDNPLECLKCIFVIYQHISPLARHILLLDFGNICSCTFPSIARN